ncbi:MAG: ATP-binding cassette domain-containing protein [Tissierellia bacterium]|jgi:peptide/nickel transport system ATP-binding protein|nr:ATP-binding cassette domain-containing protein [Tissierellia bacterium]
MSTILEVKNLKKYFRTPKGLLHAVDDISFKAKQGETLGIVGESGCGKSTLGRAIIRLHEPTSGEVIFDGQDITKLSNKEFDKVRPDMQMIFQDPYSSINPRMSVSEIISEPLIIYKRFNNRQGIENEVARLMDTVGLARRFANSYPHELDGGRRQRIGVARALSLNPKFIVCDEPVSALDVSIQAQILNLMQDLQAERNLTYLFITHDLSVVKHISNNILVMYLGNMVEYASSKDIFKTRLHPYTKALLAAVPIPVLGMKKERKLLKGEITSPIEPKPGCRFASRCEYAKEKCSNEQPELIEALEGHFVACHYVKEINNI